MDRVRVVHLDIKISVVREMQIHTQGPMLLGCRLPVVGRSRHYFLFFFKKNVANRWHTINLTGGTFALSWLVCVSFKHCLLVLLALFSRMS